MFAGIRGGTIGAGVLALAARAGIFVVLTVACGLLFTEARAQGYTFSRISVEGNEFIEPATVAKIAGIGQGQSVTEAGLNDAVTPLGRLSTAS